MRGADLFNNLIETEATVQQQRKGRNSDLIAERNELLLARYYYLRCFTELKYDAVLQQLRAEFFLSPVTIPQIVEKHVDKFLELKRMQPNVNYFRTKWPHFRW